jgi:hypothetical protein
MALKDTIGVGFELLGERMRQSFQLVVVVVKPTNLGAAQWLRSIQLCVMLFCFAYLVWFLMGPLTAMIALIGVSWWAIQHKRLGWGLYTTLLSSLPGAMTLTAHHTMDSTAFWASLATLGLLAWGAIASGLLNPHTFADQVLSLQSFQVSLPTPQFPVVLRFSQDAISDTLAVRTRLWQSERYSTHEKLFTGNKWVEAALSVVLPSAVYNNQKLRMGLQLALDLVVPCFFIVQALCVFVPFLAVLLSRLSELIASDYGARALRAALHFIGSAVVGALRAARRSVSLLQVPIRVVESAFRGVVSVLSFVVRLARPIQQFFETYVLPSDVWLLYIRTRFQRAADLLRPLGVLGRTLLEGSTYVVRSVAMPLLVVARSSVSALTALVQPLVWLARPVAEAFRMCFSMLSTRKIPNLAGIALKGAMATGSAYGKSHIIAEASTPDAGARAAARGGGGAEASTPDVGARAAARGGGGAEASTPDVGARAAARGGGGAGESGKGSDGEETREDGSVREAKTVLRDVQRLERSSGGVSAATEGTSDDDEGDGDDDDV